MTASVGAATVASGSTASADSSRAVASAHASAASTDRCVASGAGAAAASTNSGGLGGASGAGASDGRGAGCRSCAGLRCLGADAGSSGAGRAIAAVGHVSSRAVVAHSRHVVAGFGASVGDRSLVLAGEASLVGSRRDPSAGAQRASSYVGLHVFKFALESAVGALSVLSLVGRVHLGCAVVEVRPRGVTIVDYEVEGAVHPADGAEEVLGSQESVHLAAGEHVAQFFCSALPEGAEDVTHKIDVHNIVEVDLVYGIDLCSGQIEFKSHFVGQEPCLLASLAVAHCAGRDDCGHGDEGGN